jgi:hypothetical protein
VKKKATTRRAAHVRQLHRSESQLERMQEVFDTHLGGVTKAVLLLLAEVEEETLSARMATLRKRSLEIGKVPKVLKMGGEWIYGWAENLREHCQEQHKRIRGDIAREKVNIPMLKQAVFDHPESLEHKRRLVACQNHLNDLELQLADFARALGELQAA